MEVPSWVRELFDSIDRKDARAFASFLTEDARFRYGSQAMIQGKSAIEKFVAGYFASLQTIRHTIEEVWSADQGNTWFIEGTVEYTLAKGRSVQVPFLNHFSMQEGRIRDYLVFTDPTPLR
ncbi:MAG TPA: nuclear transport factor 2 family protein [Bdellovibrionota bacterium]|nr:nuclear transport factor 2 family protein [Bdellovibrionota bacterium]